MGVIVVGDFEAVDCGAVVAVGVCEDGDGEGYSVGDDVGSGEKPPPPIPKGKLPEPSAVSAQISATTMLTKPRYKSSKGNMYGCFCFYFRLGAALSAEVRG